MVLTCIVASYLGNAFLDDLISISTDEHHKKRLEENRRLIQFYAMVGAGVVAMLLSFVTLPESCAADSAKGA